MTKLRKETLIITAALVIPGGLIALGIWKAYELYKKKESDKRTKETTQRDPSDQ